jgi:hypothetical protein
MASAHELSKALGYDRTIDKDATAIHWLGAGNIGLKSKHRVIQQELAQRCGL